MWWLVGCLKVNECDVKHRCGNHAIHYTLPHTHAQMLFCPLRLCLHLATTADWAERIWYSIWPDSSQPPSPPVGVESGLWDYMLRLAGSRWQCAKLIRKWPKDVVVRGGVAISTCLLHLCYWSHRNKVTTPHSFRWHVESCYNHSITKASTWHP